MTKKKVQIFTDGGCDHRLKIGGYAAILQYKGRELLITGRERDTTSNRMELMAVIAGFERLKEPCAVTLTADSMYVLNYVDKLPSLERKRFCHGRVGNGRPIPNQDLWKRLADVIRSGNHTVKTAWVPSHSGHEFNERCDAAVGTQISLGRAGLGE